MTNDDGTVSGHGPVPGATPGGDSDLHDSPNPYGRNGTPRVDGTADTGDGFSVTGYGGPAGTYYTNPPTSGSGNPYSSGDLDSYGAGSGQISGGFDELYAAIMNQQQPTYSDQPTSADYHRDAGHGDDGMGRS